MPIPAWLMRWFGKPAVKRAIIPIPTYLTNASKSDNPYYAWLHLTGSYTNEQLLAHFSLHQGCAFIDLRIQAFNALLVQLLECVKTSTAAMGMIPAFNATTLNFQAFFQTEHGQYVNESLEWAVLVKSAIDLSGSLIDYEQLSTENRYNHRICKPLIGQLYRVCSPVSIKGAP